MLDRLLNLGWSQPGKQANIELLVAIRLREACPRLTCLITIIAMLKVAPIFINSKNPRQV